MNSPTIYTYSIIYSTTEAFKDKLPYVSALLEQEDGTRFASLLEGYTEGMEVKIGEKVKYLGKDEQGRARYSL